MLNFYYQLMHLLIKKHFHSLYLKLHTLKMSVLRTLINLI